MTTILAIEDEVSIRANLQDILELEGFDVLTAANGKVGVELARSHRPDLIICDVSMPELNGYDVLMALRQNANTIEIPFIFLTANASRADFRKGMSLGADDYLTKPFTPSELREAIAARLEKQAMLMERYKQSLERNFNTDDSSARNSNLSSSIQANDNVNTVKVVRPTGVLDVTTCERLRREIMAVVDTGCRNVVVDCQDLTFMDSSGLAALVLASQKVREANSKLAICSLNEQIEMLFALSSMDDIFEIYPSLAEFSAN
jgi:anti-anti-sigma factor